jgi:streptogramin lyase
MRNKRFSSTASAFVIALAAILMGPAPATAADELILSGAVTSSAGEAMGGVMVSAKARGATITTSVLTDDTGNYYFPPLPAGQYRVWAQALSFDTARGEVDLGATRRQNFVLRPLEDFVRQLPGNVMLSGLPAESEQDKRMKRLVRNICTGCHTASYVLQHRFDEAGWSAIIELMKNANVYGTYMGATRKPSGILDFHQQELAAYLARARGPGDNGLKIKLEPRPAGEAARVVFREYDMPLDPDAGLPSDFVQNDGSDWSLGTPSVLIPGWGVHDAWLDLDQNVWFTCNIPNKQVTIGKITSKTGAVKLFKVPAANGLAAQTHGMTRDPSGIIWFNVNPGRGGLGRLDPKTEKIDVFIPPDGMSPTGGATTVDYDGKGTIWSSAPDGALRFDPETGKFTEFKSITYKTPNGTGVTYGMAADRDGNGWWAEMTLDIIGKGNVATGKSEEVRLAPVQAEMDRVTPEARKFYETYNQPDFNNPLPWAQGPRRMGTDKADDVLWVGNSWGASLARIDTKTNATTYVPLPGEQQPYHVHVDKSHGAWTNLWGADRVMRYDPKSATWTAFDLPTRGAEPRYVSVDQPDGGPTQVVLPYFRARKVAVMTLRSEAELAALKSQAGQR